MSFISICSRLPSFLGVCTSHKENFHIIFLPLHFEAAGSGAEGDVLTPSGVTWLGFLWPLYVDKNGDFDFRVTYFAVDPVIEYEWMNEWVLWGHSSGEWLFYLGSGMRLWTLVAFEHDRHPSVSQNGALTTFGPFMCSFHLLDLRMGLTHGGIAAMTSRCFHEWIRLQTYETNKKNNKMLPNSWLICGPWVKRRETVLLQKLCAPSLAQVQHKNRIFWTVDKLGPPHSGRPPTSPTQGYNYLSNMHQECLHGYFALYNLLHMYFVFNIVSYLCVMYSRYVSYTYIIVCIAQYVSTDYYFIHCVILHVCFNISQPQILQ